MPKRSKFDSSNNDTEPSYIATPRGDGSYRIETERHSSDGSEMLGVVFFGALTVLFIFWLFSTLFSNIFNLAVKRDFGWSQYWENIADFHSDDACYFLEPPLSLSILDNRAPEPRVFVHEIPLHPFTITTVGVEAKEVEGFEEYKKYVKGNFNHELIDRRYPMILKYRGSREVEYRIEGDKFLPIDHEITWSAVSIFGSSELIHGYVLGDLDSSFGRFTVGDEYELNKSDDRELISYLNAEKYFGDRSDKGDRYAVMFDESCVPSIKDRR